jgi:hypothetical protein
MGQVGSRVVFHEPKGLDISQGTTFAVCVVAVALTARACIDTLALLGKQLDLHLGTGG